MRMLGALLGVLLVLNAAGLVALSRAEEPGRQGRGFSGLLPALRLETAQGPRDGRTLGQPLPRGGRAMEAASPQEAGPLGESLARADAMRSLASEDPRAAMERLPLILERPSDPPALRIAAARLLGESGSPRALPPLLGALRDRDPLVRLGAAEGLGLLRDPVAVPALSERLGQDLPRIQMAAAWALGEIGDPAALPHLVGFLSRGRHLASAIRALGRLGDPRAAAVLLPLLDPARRGVTEYALEALARLKAPGAFEAIARVLGEEDGDMAAEAAWALAILGDRRGLPLLEEKLTQASGQAALEIQAAERALRQKAGG